MRGSGTRARGRRNDLIARAIIIAILALLAFPALIG